MERKPAKILTPGSSEQLEESRRHALEGLVDQITKHPDSLFDEIISAMDAGKDGFNAGLSYDALKLLGIDPDKDFSGITNIDELRERLESKRFK